MKTSKLVEIKPPTTLAEKCRDAWNWRIHKARIKKNFDTTQFTRPIVTILYWDENIAAYKDSTGLWFDVSF